MCLLPNVDTIWE